MLPDASEQDRERSEKAFRRLNPVIFRMAVFRFQDHRGREPHGDTGQPEIHGWRGARLIVKLVSTNAVPVAGNRDHALDIRALLVGLAPLFGIAIGEFRTDLVAVARPGIVNPQQVAMLSGRTLLLETGVGQTDFRMLAERRRQVAAIGFLERVQPGVGTPLFANRGVQRIVEVLPHDRQGAVDHGAGSIGRERTLGHQRTRRRPDQRRGMNHIPAPHRRQELARAQVQTIGIEVIGIQPFQRQIGMLCSDPVALLPGDGPLQIKLREQA